MAFGDRLGPRLWALALFCLAQETLAQNGGVETLGLNPGSTIAELNLNWYSDNALSDDEVDLNNSYVKLWDENDELLDSVSGYAGAAPLTTANKLWHRATLTNLVPDITYKYQVSNDGQTWSQQYEYTAPPAGNKFKFAAVSDAQLDNNSDHYNNWIRVAGKIKEAKANLIVHIGDQVDGTTSDKNGGLAEEYKRFFTPDILRSIPFAPLMGNHDSHCEFIYRYNLPNEDVWPAVCSGTDKYLMTAGSNDSRFNAGNYYYLYNNILFIGLNTANYVNSIIQADGYVKNYDKLINEAKAKYSGEYDFIVVLHHKSTQTIASHAADTDIQYYVEAGLERIMTKNGVSLVLSGHDHINVRSKFLLWNEVQQKSVPNERRGTVYLTLSTASAMKTYSPFCLAAGTCSSYPTGGATAFPYLFDGMSGGINLKEDNQLLGIETYKYTQAPEYTIVEVNGETMTLRTYRYDTDNDTEEEIDNFVITTSKKPIRFYGEEPKAELPVIITQPESKTVTAVSNDFEPITVSVEDVTDGGTLSYQWYSNASASNVDGTPIPDATKPTYMVPITSVGTSYFYVVIKNTIDDEDASPTSVTSSVATVRIKKPIDPNGIRKYATWNLPTLGGYGYVKGETITATFPLDESETEFGSVSLKLQGSLSARDTTITIDEQKYIVSLEAIAEPKCSSCEYYFSGLVSTNSGGGADIIVDRKTACENLQTEKTHATATNTTAFENQRYYHLTNLGVHDFGTTGARHYINRIAVTGSSVNLDNITAAPEGGYYLYVGESRNNVKFTVSGGTDYCPVPVQYIDISKATVEVNGQYTYNGLAHIPAANNVIVTLDGKTIEASNYEIKETNNIEAGVATVTVEGTGIYTGTAEGSFAIATKGIENATMAVNGTYTYTGAAQTPSVTVTLEGYEPKYNIAVTNNINAGVAIVTVTGIGSFSGNKDVNFTIKPKDLENNMIAQIPPQLYVDGNDIEPSVTVQYNSMELVNDEDYSATYSSNTEIGTATVKIEGKNNYAGTATATFEIVAPSSSSNASSSSIDILSSSSVDYTPSSSSETQLSSSSEIQLSSSSEAQLSSSSEIQLSSSSETQLSSSSDAPSQIRLTQIANNNQAIRIHNGINLQAINKAVVEVYGLNGNLVSRQSFSGGVYIIPFGHLPKGMYIVKASFGSEKRILKMPVN